MGLDVFPTSANVHETDTLYRDPYRGIKTAPPLNAVMELPEGPFLTCGPKQMTLSASLVGRNVLAWKKHSGTRRHTPLSPIGRNLCPRGAVLR